MSQADIIVMENHLRKLKINLRINYKDLKMRKVLQARIERSKRWIEELRTS